MLLFLLSLLHFFFFMPLQVLSSSFPSPFFPLLNCSFPSGVSYCRYFITVFFKHLTHHLFLVHPFLSAALNLLVKWWRIDPASRSWRLLRLGERSFSISPAFHQLCSHAARLDALLFRSHSLTTGHQLAASRHLKLNVSLRTWSWDSGLWSVFCVLFLSYDVLFCFCSSVTLNMNFYCESFNTLPPSSCADVLSYYPTHSSVASQQIAHNHHWASKHCCCLVLTL